MGQVVVHKRLKTMKNSKTVPPKSGGSGLQFKRCLFTGGVRVRVRVRGVQQYCKALMTLVLRMGYGRCSHSLRGRRSKGKGKGIRARDHA